MSTTRNNHYVPKWYQEGFFEPGRDTYSYFDLSPRQHTLRDGRIVTEKSNFVSPTSRAFCQKDLYSTFFGTSVNDEIERKLFGDIDTRGALAVRAFTGSDVSEWHHQFIPFFQYLDIQKIRTPKGLDWLRAQYPRLTQNDLMFEMQGIQMMHCTIWTEGVREIVSAEDASVKFIVSDHPVTIYNYAISPSAIGNAYPNDPSIAMKGSQTIFPLNRDLCVILTNLEYAKDHSTDPIQKRTFAGNFRNSMVRTDAFIRSRKLTNDEVVRVNRVIKSRAKRYIAAGKEEWLYPEVTSNEPWADLRSVFLPPEDGLWRFGGQIYARGDSGDVYYQDEFGRTEQERNFLKKSVRSKPLRMHDRCGCGSGRAFGLCCKVKPVTLRPTWTELSIRERNLLLLNGISNILGLTADRDWVTVRQEMTDENIRDVYSLYDTLWPRETNLLSMLPKPDGSARAVYTGLLHPSFISNCALGLSLYFDEIIIDHPFIYPRILNKEFNPVENLKSYRAEFLKSVILFMEIMPLVDQGLVILCPDPGNFDFHLRSQMFEMAKFRSKGIKIDPKEEFGYAELMKDDQRRSILMLSRDSLRRHVLQQTPTLDEKALDKILDNFDWMREHDPLSVSQEGSLDGGREGGQLTSFKMTPNFEITMYLAQATGSCIVTDSIFRWRELAMTAERNSQGPPPLIQLRTTLQQAELAFPQDANEIRILAGQSAFGNYPSVMRRIFKYLCSLSEKGSKPNVEANLTAELARAMKSTDVAARKSGTHWSKAKVSCLWPEGGIQDNTVNRLLLMSSSEHHLASAPMALFFKNLSSR